VQICKRLAYALWTLLLSLTTLFFLIRLAPGDPIERVLGPEASELEINSFREQLGLNESLLNQFLQFLNGLFTGDLGQSLFKNRSVKEMLFEHVPPTIILAFLSVFIAFFMGTAIGALTAYYKSTWKDSLLRFLTLLSLAFPIFSLAPLLVIIFSIQLGILPVSEWGSLKHVVLPTVSISIPLSAILSRVARNKYLEEVRSPWVVVLRSKGLSEFAIVLRIIKICLPTLLNVVAIQLSVVLAGTMITETIFDIPGMGMLLLEGIQNRDYPVVQGVIAYSTIIYLGVYFLVDFVNGYIDPRMRE
jgi:peptide/nickel transport system permease protein